MFESSATRCVQVAASLAGLAACGTPDDFGRVRL